MKARITISPRRLTRLLTFVVLGLTLASVAGNLSTFYLSPGEGLLKQVQKSYIRLFYVDLETNIPTWYEGITLFVCSLLLGTIACVKKAQQGPYVRHWTAMAIIFLYISMDEEAIIHEMAIKPLHNALHTGGILYYAWVIPGAAAVLLFVLTYLRFLWHLPLRSRLLFIVAGAIYVGGALGVEALSGMRSERYGEGDAIYVILATLEEVMEMVGILFFIYALLDYIGRYIGEVVLSINAVAPRGATEQPPKPAPAALREIGMVAETVEGA